MNDVALINIVADVVVLVVMLVIAFGNTQNKVLNNIKIIDRTFLWMLTVDIIMVIMSIISYAAPFVFDSTVSEYIIKISIFVQLISYHIELILYALYIYRSISEKTELRPVFFVIAVIVCALSGVMWVISMFNGLLGYRTAAGFVRGPLYHLGQIGGFAILVWNYGVAAFHRKKLSMNDFAGLIFFPLFPLLGSIMRLFYDKISYMPIMCSLSLLMIYHFIHLDRISRYKEQQDALEKAGMQIALNQIGPHFMYNTLNSISCLCLQDPEAASECVNDFAEYLRGNMNSLNLEEKIPFEKEIQHVNHYLKLEKIRFDDLLSFEYHIDDDNFFIPPLSVQPIVENAVKHGIGKKENGGSIVISAEKIGSNYVIKVTDDGVGFDTGTVMENSSNHIGIKNVTERIEKLSNGTVDISSEPDKGTTVTITIPEKGNEIGKSKTF